MSGKEKPNQKKNNKPTKPNNIKTKNQNKKADWFEIKHHLWKSGKLEIWCYLISDLSRQARLEGPLLSHKDIAKKLICATIISNSINRKGI